MFPQKLFEGIKNSSELAAKQVELASSLDGNDLEYVQAACLLHSVGLFFGKKGYHKQSYRIIMVLCLFLSRLFCLQRENVLKIYF